MCRYLSLIVVGLIFASCAKPPEPDSSMIDLSGAWRFALDEENAGFDAKWYATTLTDEVQLPGTTDENKKGIHPGWKPAVGQWNSGFPARTGRLRQLSTDRLCSHG